MARTGTFQLLSIWISLVISSSICEQVTVKSDLETAEANGKLEIIKQIKKVNDDGSYTIGYEADDGSFKIESRDVLGNIKGTYGYIDDNGDIKRVSYTTSNVSEVVTSTEAPSSVVQRIPAKFNRTLTTLRPSLATSTSSPNIVHILPKKRITTTTTTSTPTPFVYETSTPARLLAQSKPLVRSSPLISTTTNVPEVKPTDLPLYNRLLLKPITEASEEEKNEKEVRGNLLRRQLSQEKTTPVTPVLSSSPVFDARAHVLNLQQAGGGHDVSDVYSGAGTPRPLFTTIRPRIISSTVSPLLQRRYPHPIYKPTTPRITPVTESTSTEPTVTPSPVPVVQIPPNPEEPQRSQYVQLRHPFHRGAVLVPVDGRQQQIYNQAEDYPQPEDYHQAQTNSQPHPHPHPHPQPHPQPQPIYVRKQIEEPVYLRKVPKYRPINVQVDDNGYVREYPYARPVPVNYYPEEVSRADLINEVDQIKPPVSTKDFQKLLEQLIIRQKTLEKISLLSQRQRYQDDYGSYQPMKRMAKAAYVYPQNNEEYLPAPVREMLLLKMLQLAINPALPVEISEDSVASGTTPHPRKVKNVEILGEEREEKRGRSKRFKEVEFDYYED